MKTRLLDRVPSRNMMKTGPQEVFDRKKRHAIKNRHTITAKWRNGIPIVDNCYREPFFSVSLFEFPNPAIFFNRVDKVRFNHGNIECAPRNNGP